MMVVVGYLLVTYKGNLMNDAYSSWWSALIITSFFFGILNFFLHTSNQEKLIAAPTLLVASVAILSTIIVVCAFIVTATGLAKLESIEEEAIEAAKRQAKKTTSKFLKSVLIPE